MNTGKLVVEIVIIGFQVVVWLGLLCLVFAGVGWIDLEFMKFLKEWSFFLSVVMIGTSYTLGLVFDSVAGQVFKHISRKRWHRLLHRKLAHMIPASVVIEGRIEPRPSIESFPDWMGVHPEDMWYYILYLSKDMGLELQRRQHPLSLIRSTLVNVGLIGLLSLDVVFENTNLTITWAAILIFGAALLMALLFRTWNTILETYYATLVGSLRLLDERETSSAGTEGDK